MGNCRLDVSSHSGKTIAFGFSTDLSQCFYLAFEEQNAFDGELQAFLAGEIFLGISQPQGK